MTTESAATTLAASVAEAIAASRVATPADREKALPKIIRALTIVLQGAGYDPIDIGREFLFRGAIETTAHGSPHTTAGYLAELSYLVANEEEIH